MRQPEAPAVTERDGVALARRAAAAVADRLAGRPTDGRLPGAPSLRALGATFVTLEQDGALLGCIGSLDPARPLYLDAMRNAVRATTDPRLPPVTAAQWPTATVVVSVLSVAEPLPVRTPDELLSRLRVGVDGLILTDGQRRATFLPSVWHKLNDPERFVTALLRKGGWYPEWPDGMSALRYTATEYTDPAPRPALRPRPREAPGAPADQGEKHVD